MSATITMPRIASLNQFLRAAEPTTTKFNQFLSQHGIGYLRAESITYKSGQRETEILKTILVQGGARLLHEEIIEGNRTITLITRAVIPTNAGKINMLTLMGQNNGCQGFDSIGVYPAPNFLTYAGVLHELYEALKYTRADIQELSSIPNMKHRITLENGLALNLSAQNLPSGNSQKTANK